MNIHLTLFTFSMHYFRERSNYHFQDNVKQKFKKLPDFILEKLRCMPYPECWLHYFLLNRTIVTIWCTCILSSQIISYVLALSLKEPLVFINKKHKANFLYIHISWYLTSWWRPCVKKSKSQKTNNLTRVLAVGTESRSINDMHILSNLFIPHKI